MSWWVRGIKSWPIIIPLLVPKMVGSGLDSWGNIPLSLAATGMLSHSKISSFVALVLFPLMDGQKRRYQKKDWWFSMRSTVVTIWINYLEAVLASVNVKDLFMSCHQRGLAWLVSSFKKKSFRELHREWSHGNRKMHWWGIGNVLIKIRPDRAQVFYVTQKDWKAMNTHNIHFSQISSYFSFIWLQKQLFQVSLVLNFLLSILISSLERARCSKDMAIQSLGFLWSHLTAILDFKSTTLTGTGCQIKPP